MSEPVTALNNATFDGLVRVEEIGPKGMITLRGDLASPALSKAASSASGTAMPAQRGASVEGDKGLLWMSPDELLVLCDYAGAEATTADLTAALAGEHAMAVNVSDARAVFRITGANVRDVLAKLAPADLSKEGLPLGELKRTRLAQVAAAFWLRSDEEAEIICFRSVADYVFGLLKVASHPASAVDFH